MSRQMIWTCNFDGFENFLNGFGGPVVTVSHDRYFLDKVANKILAFEEGVFESSLVTTQTTLMKKPSYKSNQPSSRRKKSKLALKLRKLKKTKNA